MTGIDRKPEKQEISMEKQEFVFNRLKKAKKTEKLTAIVELSSSKTNSEGEEESSVEIQMGCTSTLSSLKKSKRQNTMSTEIVTTLVCTQVIKKLFIFLWLKVLVIVQITSQLIAQLFIEVAFGKATNFGDIKTTFKPIVH